MFSYFNSKLEGLEHESQGKIINIKKFTTSSTSRIYFESIPKQIFYYDGTLPEGSGVGKVVTIYYNEVVCGNYLQLWITSMRLIDDTENAYPNAVYRFKRTIKHEENFNIYCLYCEHKMLLSNNKMCTGQIYQPFLRDVQCNKCNLVHDRNLEAPCSTFIVTCDKCHHDRLFK